ncbi:hypothetical protein [uncultured Paludibaculum sp.]|uniref:hypothetical protein n=1 Tax=uncultured Paludibaculum sp. TaxID=1765020 RepID=UPI00374D5E29
MRFAQAALFAIFLGGAAFTSAPGLAPEGIPDSLLAAIRGTCRPAESTSFHHPPRPEMRLERTRSAAAQPFAAGLPARRADHARLPENPGARGHFQTGRLPGGLFDTRPARAPPALLS